MVERHYSPRATLRIINGSAEEVADARRDGSTILGALALGSGNLARLEHCVQMAAEPAEYARALYAALHELDERGCEVVLVEAVPATAEWAGIRDRLERASHRA
jgi:L-threonylcarbamoyladenylate synthase